MICLLVASMVAQPFTPSELAWPRGGNRNGAPDCSTVTAVNSFVSVAKNGVGTITLHGGGGTFSILSGPISGSLSGLDASLGKVDYTPAVNFSGTDAFMFQVQSGACLTNATIYISVVDTNTGDPQCVVVAGVGYFDSTLTTCWTTTSNGVIVDQGCTTQTTTFPGPGYFDGTLCAYVRLCDVTNTVSTLGYSVPFGDFLSIKNTNWFKLHEVFGPQGNCRAFSDYYFFCNQTTNTTLNLSGVYESALATGGSNLCFVYFGNVLVTNLSRGNPVGIFNYTWNASITIPSSNKVTITISNYTCNASPNVWITNTLSP